MYIPRIFNRVVLDDPDGPITAMKSPFFANPQQRVNMISLVVPEVATQALEEDDLVRLSHDIDIFFKIN